MSRHHWLEIWGFNVRASQPKGTRQSEEAAAESERHLEALLRRLRGRPRHPDMQPD